VIPAAVPSALQVLPRPSIDGHELQLRRIGKSAWVGCACKPGWWRSIVRDGLPATWASFTHDTTTATAQEATS
jgi:hypothetical protein